jgi:hypothetical protein
MSAETAVRIAKNVGEIGFPEFTAKLVTDTFDALISANMRQTEAYIELMATVAKSLATFINDTKDDISGPMILDFLKLVLPEADGTKVKKGATLTAADATKLNDTLLIKDASGAKLQETSIAAGALTDAKYQPILDAVAKRLAANKYDALQQMVKLGMLRLVIEKGLIETRLTFNTYGYDYSSAVSSSYNSSSSRSVAASGLLSTIFNGPSASVNSRLSVSTASQRQFDSTGSSVQIFGLVQLNFKTDYMPLNQ